MNYHFEVENGKFHLSDHRQGKNWENKLFNKIGYQCTVSHTGGICSKFVDEANNQVSVNAPGGNLLYLRDEENGEYWNVGYYPACRQITDYHCVHRQGSTAISSVHDGIYGEINFAVAENDTYEIWKVTVKNISGRQRKLSTFALTTFDQNGFAQPVYYSSVTTAATEYVAEANGIVSLMHNPYAPHERVQAFLTCSETPYSYDGSLDSVIGALGSYAKPDILENKEDLKRSMAVVRPKCGALQNKISLLDSEEKTLYYFVGLTSSQKKLIALQREMNGSAEKITVHCDALARERFGGLRTRTPNDRINSIMNYWAVKQVSYCTIGKKAVRDNAQLAMAVLNFDSAFAKSIIDECLVHQYADGHAVLTWYPYLEKNIYSDPSFWLTIAVCEYIMETGDIGYLNQKFEYLDGGVADVYEHILAAEAWLSRTESWGRHGLPKIFHADWNDALNIPDDEAESVLMAMFLCYLYKKLIELNTFLKNDEKVGEYARKKQELTDTINRTAYNGAYYVRAFSRFGTVGDKDDANGGNIYVNPQTWAILADVVPEQYRESVLKSIDSMETEQGIPLCSPAYRRYDSHVGRMSGMLPGVYENGGIYNHAGCFKVMADCALKRADHAVSTLLKIIPDGKDNPSSVTTTEPYVFTNCYLKHKAVDMQVGFSWQTGTSAWGLMCFYEGILGIKRTYAGLRIDPCLPADWENISAFRCFRGCRYRIVYRRLPNVEKKTLFDGERLSGDTLPVCRDGGVHLVEVYI